MQYYTLTDELNFNEIIKKDENGHCFQYKFGIEQWYQSSIMLNYDWPDDYRFGKYTMISENEAMKLLGEQRAKFNLLLNTCMELGDSIFDNKSSKVEINHFKYVISLLNSTEEKIVAYLQLIIMNSDIMLEKLSEMGFTFRMINSVRNLINVYELSYEEYFALIRSDINACNVKIAEIKYSINELKKKQIFDDNLERYNAVLIYLES